MSQYEIPTFGGNGGTLLGWLMEAVQQGKAWQQTQSPMRDYDKVLKLFDSASNDTLAGQSNTGFNIVKRNARDIVASLTNFRHEGEFRPTFDQELYDQAHVLTKLDHAWAQRRRAYVQLRAGIQYAVAFGTAYWYLDYDKYATPAAGDLRLRAIAPQDVTFLQLPGDHDIQKAYMVIIREELPINYARWIFQNPGILPDRDEPGWINKGLQAVQRLMGGSPALAAAGMGTNNRSSFPTVDVYTGYTLDMSLNETGRPLTMGAHGTNWSYTVPSLGDPMDTGILNPATSQNFTRPAGPMDALLFPLRRMTIWTSTMSLYDGSSPWWHGATPLARLRFDDWAWQSLGTSLLAESQTMQEGIEATMRGIEDSIAARLDPAALYDDTLVSEGFSQAFNPRKAGARAAADLNSGGKVMEFPVSVEHYNVPAYIPDYVQKQIDRINHMMGVPDLVAMAKAKQVPGQGTLEKLMEMAGPLVDDMVRAQEEPYMQLGEWRKALYFQFYTRNRFIKFTGPSDDASYEFQYTPDMLIERMADDTPDRREARSKRLISEFTFYLEESSINERHRMSTKLTLLQLKKAGVMIDDWTITEAFSIHNYGPKPEGTRNVMERFIAEQHIKRELAEEMGAGQQGKGAGRPPSNQKAPQLKQKDGGSRSTITTS